MTGAHKAGQFPDFIEYYIDTQSPRALARPLDMSLVMAID